MTIKFKFIQIKFASWCIVYSNRIFFLRSCRWCRCTIGCWSSWNWKPNYISSMSHPPAPLNLVRCRWFFLLQLSKNIFSILILFFYIINFILLPGSVWLLSAWFETFHFVFLLSTIVAVAGPSQNLARCRSVGPSISLFYQHYFSNIIYNIIFFTFIFNISQWLLAGGGSQCTPYQMEKWLSLSMAAFWSCIFFETNLMFASWNCYFWYRRTSIRLDNYNQT